MSPFKAGILAVTTILVVTYFGFTKANPFSNPYELHAMFRDVQNLKPRSPVRIAASKSARSPRSSRRGAGSAT